MFASISCNCFKTCRIVLLLVFIEISSKAKKLSESLSKGYKSGQNLNSATKLEFATK